MFAIRVLICAVSLGLGLVSSRSMTMMSSKYLGKSPVFVAGGSNGVGLEVVKQLSSLGTPVHVLARRQVCHLTVITHLEPDSWIRTSNLHERSFFILASHERYHTRLTMYTQLSTQQESKSELEKFTGVTVMIGDAMDEAAIQKCMQGNVYLHLWRIKNC